MRKNVVKKLTDEATALSNSTGGESAGDFKHFVNAWTLYLQLMSFEKRLIGKALAVGNATNNVVAAAIDGKTAEGAHLTHHN